MDMLFISPAEAEMLYVIIRMVNVALSLIVLGSIPFRWRLWRTSPRLHIKMLGMLGILMPITMLTAALDQWQRDLAPGAPGVGSMSILLVLGAAIVSLPESDDSSAPALRWLERIGVRFRASRQSRR